MPTRSMTFARRVPLLAGVLLLPWLASCGGAPPAGDRVSGARGTVVESVRGAAADGDVLRPEPGNIWSEGLDRASPGRRTGDMTN